MCVLFTDGPREQAYIERSIRDIIESTKQALEDARYVHAMVFNFIFSSIEPTDLAYDLSG